MANYAIVGVNLRSHENNRAHRTEEIDQKRLIVRRGKPFTISLRLSDSVSLKHQLALILYLGKKNEVAIKVQPNYGNGKKWWFRQERAQGETLLTVNSPADAIIGNYSMTVLMLSPDGRTLDKTKFQHFHLLFNPWCKDDAVYLPDETLLQEYILNENGVIYSGNWNSIQERPWNFGQFEDNVMDICFKLLDKKEDISRRSDPVYIGRTITAMVNSNDEDSGVLDGKWNEPYDDGVAPFKWTGSVPILQKWSSQGKSVRYGQCWVFAGVAVTVLRCLGIPTRLITNFNSAHDTDGNLSVDTLYDEHFNIIGKSDSDWNFHCWVESWMRRDDLHKGFDGWQVLDPTPQERSEGVFCCGPCPVTAIKEGTLGVKYDAPFVFAEVNADVVSWMVRKDGKQQKLSSNQDIIGRNISTKSVYGDYREDVTNHYKYPEGSAKEREVYEKAGRRLIDPPGPGETSTELELLPIKHAQPIFGTDFDIIVELKNRGSQDVKAQLILVSSAVTYNSFHMGECMRKTASVVVPANTTHKEALRMLYENYAKCVGLSNRIQVRVLAEVAGQNEPLLQKTVISLTKPELLVTINGQAMLNKHVKARISFVNPLPVKLNKGVFTVEGAGLMSSTEFHVSGAIAPNQEVSVELSFTPTRYGVRKLIADFDSDRLSDVKGVATVHVYKRPHIFNMFE